MKIIELDSQNKVYVGNNAKENFENTDNFKNYLRLQAKLFVSNKSFMHHKTLDFKLYNFKLIKRRCSKRY